jgi:osmotically-inducible protein OsmY
VDSFYKKMLAEDIASGIVGFVAVRNSLDVAERNTRKSDKQLKEDIRDQLWWSPFVDSDDIAVSVEDGVATLVGRVESLRDRRTATQNAYDAGALDVRNMLEIPGQPPE